MPLQKQMFSVPVSGGIDTKTDPKQVLAGKLLEADNVQFLKTGELSTRFGFTALPDSPTENNVALASLGEELVLADGAEIYSYASQNALWATRGRMIGCIATDQTIIRMNSAQQLNADVGYNGAIETYLWEDTRNGGQVFGCIIDSLTRAVLFDFSLGSVGGVKPKVIVANTTTHLYWIEGTTLKHATVTSSTVGTTVVYSISVGADITAALNNPSSYDACAIGSGTFIAYVGNTPSIKIVNGLNGVLIATVDTGANAYNGGPAVVSISGDTGTALWVAWGTGTELRIASYTTLGVAQQVSTHLAFVAVDTIATLTNNATPGTPATAKCFLIYEIHAASSINHRIAGGGVQAVGAVSAGSSSLRRGVGLASKPFLVGGTTFDAPSTIFVNLSFSTTLQASYFTEAFVFTGPSTIDPGNFEVAKTQPGVGQGHRTNAMLSEVAIINGGVGGYLWANGQKGKTESEANTIFSLVGVSSTILNFASRNRYRSAEAARNLIFANALPMFYDGRTVAELGFNVYPEGVVGVSLGGGGSIDVGDHQYTVTYEWSDDLGQIQRSATSVPITVTAIANDQIQLTIPTLRLTSKANVVIHIYRTAVGGSVFHRVSSVLSPLLNDPTSDTVTFTDSISDASAAANEVVYTTGGVLDNISPPASSVITTHQGRVFLAGLEDPNLIWFSKNRFDNSNANTVPVEFAAELTIGVDAFGGAITAIKSLDDKVVVYKETAIFIVSGDGPNDTGQGAVYADAQLLTSDVGCTNPDSVVTTPNGIMFKSAKGIYILDRAASVSYIGAPVEDLLGIITSATLLHTRNQVVFTQLNAQALVYDYFYGQWLTWSNVSAVDATVWQDHLIIARDSDLAGSIWQQSFSSYTDPGSAFIPWTVTTPNLSFAGLANWARTFRLFVLGTYVSGHNLTIDVAYDDSGTYQPNPAVFTPVIGDGLYAYRVDFARQKATSIRVRLTTQANGPAGASLRLSALDFEGGALPGGLRLPARQTQGAS